MGQLAVSEEKRTWSSERKRCPAAVCVGVREREGERERKREGNKKRRSHIKPLLVERSMLRAETRGIGTDARAAYDGICHLHSLDT